MTQAKPTPGPWIVDEITEGGFVSNGTADICYQPFEKSTHGYNNWSANAAIIAEAGTVYHETGLSPRQLLAQRDALLDILKKCVNDYKGLATTCNKHGLLGTEKDALETVDYINKAIAKIEGKHD